MSVDISYVSLEIICSPALIFLVWDTAFQGKGKLNFNTTHELYRFMKPFHELFERVDHKTPDSVRRILKTNETRFVQSGLIRKQRV